MSNILVQAAYVLAAPRPQVPHDDPGPFDTDITGWETIGNVLLFAGIIAVVVFLVKAVRKKGDDDLVDPYSVDEPSDERRSGGS